jgi:hypothetical protein
MKNVRRLLRSRRAIEPIIATLILMLLAVSAGVLIYSYAMGWLGGATGDTGGVKGRMQFDSIYANATSGILKIYVRNVGSQDVLLSKIYIAGAEKANATVIPAAGRTLAVQSVAYLQVSNTMSKGYTYEVKVVCKDGTITTQSAEAE